MQQGGGSALGGGGAGSGARASTGASSRGSGAAAGDKRTSEQRAAARLLAAPAPVPDASVLEAAVAKTDSRRQLLLQAQDDLCASCDWARELMSFTDAPVPTTNFDTLRSTLNEWQVKGKRACAAQTEAHDTAVLLLRQGAARLVADVKRLRKCERAEDAFAIARDAEATYPGLLLRERITATPVPPEASAAVREPTSGLVSL